MEKCNIYLEKNLNNRQIFYKGRVILENIVEKVETIENIRSKGGMERIMEKEVIRISVRILVEFILRSGDLDT